MGDNNAVVADTAIEGMLPTSAKVFSYQSKSVASFLPAFLAAKKTQDSAIRNSVNAEYDNGGYADLAECIEATEPSCLENGLVPTPVIVQSDTHFGVDYCLRHAESSEFIACRVMFPISPKHDAQAFGSMRTYAHRYAICTLHNLKVKDDDDGNRASLRTNGNRPANQPAVTVEGTKGTAEAPAPRPATDNQRNLLTKLSKEKAVEFDERVLKDSKMASAEIDRLKKLENKVVISEVTDAPASDAPTAQDLPADEGAKDAAPKVEPERSQKFKNLKAKWVKPAKSKDEAVSRGNYIEQMKSTKVINEEEATILVKDCATFSG